MIYRRKSMTQLHANDSLRYEEKGSKGIYEEAKEMRAVLEFLINRKKGR